MKLHSIFSAIVIVATTSACADVLNVEVLDLDAPREEPPTVVPARPPDDPEPVDEPYERPSLLGRRKLLISLPRRCFSGRGELLWITLTWLMRTG